jgi:hypothetical protein
MTDDQTKIDRRGGVAVGSAFSAGPSQSGKAMGKLLAAHDGSLGDKIATVKTAQLVDKGRFETAFKTLMKR